MFYDLGQMADYTNADDVMISFADILGVKSNQG